MCFIFTYLYNNLSGPVSTPRRLTTVSNVHAEVEFREGLIVQTRNRSKI